MKFGLSRVQRNVDSLTQVGGETVPGFDGSIFGLKMGLIAACLNRPINCFVLYFPSPLSCPLSVSPQREKGSHKWEKSCG